MVRIDIGQYKKIRAAYFFINCILLILTIMANIVPTYGISENHTNIDKGSGIQCLNCHSSHQISRSEPPAAGNDKNPPVPSNDFKLISSAEVKGNITLISSLGQTWYQQGIYGPNASGNSSVDKSWGWTFFDEIPASGYTIPPEKVIQKNTIYALLLDSGNNSTPIKGGDVKANITYWKYDGTTYTNNTIQVNLTEDPDHSGFYSGNFYFYGGTSYAGYGMDWCDGCHLSYYTSQPDWQIGYFPGNYTVLVSASANSKHAASGVNFEVTPWGCEDCHGSGDQHRRNGINVRESDMDSACYLCHGKNFGTDAGNPHQNKAHQELNCLDCHTNKSIDQKIFGGVAFSQGGINNGNIPEYAYVTTPLNSGLHLNMSCKECHDDLSLPEIDGSYRNDNYTFRYTVNNFTPNFAGLQQFQDYYAINATTGGPLNISLDWEGGSNIGFHLYPPNFNPRNRSDPADPDKGDRPYYNGSSTNKPEYYVNNTPLQGKWILSVYGYNYMDGIGILQPPLNYTINSTYPMKLKKLPKIPECRSCHNLNGAGKAFTTDNIPDWNPGFAHVDTNNDSKPDIQCRMCHNAMHEIIIKDCKSCHITATVSHPVKEPEYSQKTLAECLGCHGDPHKVTSAGGTDCISCHSPGDVNISKFARHADINISDGAGNVTNNDCWTCHYKKDMNRNNVYLCESCHSNSSGIVPVTNVSLIMNDFMHGMTICKTCHAPSSYHQKGSAGPLGAVENILRKLHA